MGWAFATEEGLPRPAVARAARWPPLRDRADLRPTRSGGPAAYAIGRISIRLRQRRTGEASFVSKRQVAYVKGRGLLCSNRWASPSFQQAAGAVETAG
jgi:hypothetical protein